MRAHSNTATDFGPQFTDATRASNGRYGPLSEPYDSAQILAGLALEHRDLDEMIAVLSEYSPSDGSLITRLKKRKLHLKDQMARIAGDRPLADKFQDGLNAARIEIGFGFAFWVSLIFMVLQFGST
jgi:hypothetical protein